MFYWFIGLLVYWFIGRLYPHNNHQYLESCFGKLAKENNEIYICGDFNYDLIKMETGHTIQNFFNLLCSYGFLPHIIQPTRLTENTTTCIDNIFSTNIQDEVISGKILFTLSEHLSQFVSVKREKIDIKVMNIFQRDYSSFTNESFRDDISIQKWNYSYTNVQDLFNDFYVKLDGCVNRHAPLKTSSPKEIKAKFKHWVSGKILKMIKIRDKAYARNKRQANNENCKRLYNLFRNRVNREFKKSTKQYYAEYFAENVNNIKKTWDGIRKIVNIKKKAVNSTQLNIGGKIVVDDKEVASHFNKFFVNVGPSTEKNNPKGS